MFVHISIILWTCYQNAGFENIPQDSFIVRNTLTAGMTIFQCFFLFIFLFLQGMAKETEGSTRIFPQLLNSTIVQQPRLGHTWAWLKVKVQTPSGSPTVLGGPIFHASICCLPAYICQKWIGNRESQTPFQALQYVIQANQERFNRGITIPAPDVTRL